MYVHVSKKYLQPFSLPKHLGKQRKHGDFKLCFEGGQKSLTCFFIGNVSWTHPKNLRGGGGGGGELNHLWYVILPRILRNIQIAGIKLTFLSTGSHTARGFDLSMSRALLGRGGEEWDGKRTPPPYGPIWWTFDSRVRISQVHVANTMPHFLRRHPPLKEKNALGKHRKKPSQQPDYQGLLVSRPQRLFHKSGLSKADRTYWCVKRNGESNIVFFMIYGQYTLYCSSFP